MNALVYLKNNEAVCDSLQVAEHFHKRHDRVLRAIDNLVKSLPKNGERKMYILSHRKAADGQIHRMYYMNRDGFSLLVMGFNGKKALEWKLQYINAFNKMEAYIKEKASAEYIEARQSGKLIRKEETDSIKNFVEYCKAHGSKNAYWYYKAYTSLTNKTAGIDKRDNATTKQLINLAFLESVIKHMIDEGIEADTYYKEIYQNCKTRMEVISNLAYLGVTVDELINA